MVINTTELIEIGEVRDRLGREITPAARRAEWVAAWRQSGRTRAEFARAEGVNYTTFVSWVQQERAPRPKRRREEVRFAEVRLPMSPAAPALQPSLGRIGRVRLCAVRAFRRNEPVGVGVLRERKSEDAKAKIRGVRPLRQQVDRYFPCRPCVPWAMPDQ
ncbi:MAG TPA: hypothetical protein VHD32_03535 [Candidatus Didemnitutus sp.]|nr:hypothetical protein [Candidatus Didemnitutus sp.]